MSEENTVPEWAAELPEAIQNAPFMANSENMDQFVERLTHASQHVGNSVRIPGPDAGEDDWSAFNQKLMDKVPDLVQIKEGDNSVFNRLGKPEDKDGYGAGDDHGWLAEIALEANLTKDQFTSFVEKLSNVNEERSVNSRAEHQQALDELYAEWGLSKDKQMKNIAALAKLTDAPEAMVESITEGKTDAATLKWLAGIASKFESDTNIAGDRNDPNSMNPQEINTQIQEILNNPAYFDSSKPAVQNELKKKMQTLQQARAQLESSKPIQATPDQLREMFFRGT